LWANLRTINLQQNMDFNLTEEHLMIQQAAKDFAAELLPGVIERDEHSKFPTEQVKMMADLGLWE
jgi:alkylation response protein AidB-like acyl-CoA dehydrogenase